METLAQPLWFSVASLWFSVVLCDITRSYTELHRVTQSYTELHRVTQSYTELHGVTRSYTELHGVTRRATEFFYPQIVESVSIPQKKSTKIRKIRIIRVPFSKKITKKIPPKKKCSMKNKDLRFFNKIILPCKRLKYYLLLNQSRNSAKFYAFIQNMFGISFVYLHFILLILVILFYLFCFYDLLLV
jgi:hypothetical protein